MASRLWPRLLRGARVLPRLPFGFLLRRRPQRPRRILVAHHLLLGDTIMLAPLLKKLRRELPPAEIVVLCPLPWLPLFVGQPYGVQALPLDLRSLANQRTLIAAGPFDWALVPGDNRWSWIARAMGARWITAFAGDAPASKSWPVDEFVDWPDTAASWGDIAATLVPGAPPAPFCAGEWPPPPRPADFPDLPQRYCVMHLGASSPHKRWPAENWRRLAAWAVAREYSVVVSVGPHEAALVEAVDPDGSYIHAAGRFDVAGLWHLVAGAAFLVCPDTGVAHLARLTGTPTVALFGPGSPIVSGPGRFWENSPFASVWIEDVACRDQNLLFERPLPWVRQCWRGVAECGQPHCMWRIDVEQVVETVERVVGARPERREA